MTLTKGSLANSIYNQCGYSKPKSAALIESLLEIMKSTLAAGKNIMITGFGKFSVKNNQTLGKI